MWYIQGWCFFSFGNHTKTSRRIGGLLVAEIRYCLHKKCAVVRNFKHQVVYREFLKRLVLVCWRGAGPDERRAWQVLSRNKNSCLRNSLYYLIVHGVNLEEHDQNLHAVLQRLRESVLTLNGAKCGFRLHRVTFFGHDLSSEGVTPSKMKVAAVLNAQAPKNTSKYGRLYSSCSTHQSSSPTIHKWQNLYGNYSGKKNPLPGVMNNTIQYNILYLTKLT